MGKGVGGDTVDEAALIKSILRGDKVMRRSRVVVVGKQKAFFQVNQERSRAEMFIKCFAFALHNYQFCAI